MSDSVNPGGAGSQSIDTRAQELFDKAASVASKQADYAILLYLQGLMIAPDHVPAHEGLRSVALARKSTGGGSLGIHEALARRWRSGHPLHALLTAEQQLAYDPHHVGHMVTLLQQAARSNLPNTIVWIGKVLFAQLSGSDAGDIAKFILLKDAYKSIGKWELAIEACERAVSIKPGDAVLAAELTRLQAEAAIERGNYESPLGFRASVVKQQESKPAFPEMKPVPRIDPLMKAVQTTERAWQLDPNLENMLRYIDALEQTQEPRHEDAAVEMLKELFAQTQDMQYRIRIGRIKMAQLKRDERAIRAEADAHPDDPQAAEQYRAYRIAQLEFELDEYRLWSQSNPENAALRAEIASRQMALRRFQSSMRPAPTLSGA